MHTPSYVKKCPWKWKIAFSSGSFSSVLLCFIRSSPSILLLFFAAWFPLSLIFSAWIIVRWGGGWTEQHAFVLCVCGIKVSTYGFHKKQTVTTTCLFYKIIQKYVHEFKHKSTENVRTPLLRKELSLNIESCSPFIPLLVCAVLLRSSSVLPSPLLCCCFVGAPAYLLGVN